MGWWLVLSPALETSRVRRGRGWELLHRPQPLFAGRLSHGGLWAVVLVLCCQQNLSSLGTVGHGGGGVKQRRLACFHCHPILLPPV